MKTIRDKFPKSEINNLPRILFEGPIHVIISEREAAAAVNYLMQFDTLGIDTETRPIFTKGKMRKVALLQISTYDTCFLFRLNRTDITDSIASLIESPRIKKVGLSVHDDVMALNRRRRVSGANFVDLQNEVKALGIQDMSLQKICANLFGKKVAKNQQLSNWEADCLSESQQRYAATDAWICLLLLDEVNRLKETGDYKLEITPTPPPPTEAENAQDINKETNISA